MKMVFAKDCLRLAGKCSFDFSDPLFNEYVNSMNVNETPKTEPDKN